jgi:hypothetical protein
MAVMAAAVGARVSMRQWRPTPESCVVDTSFAAVDALAIPDGSNFLRCQMT